ncbi:MAG TPA: hypothetical protein VHT96_18455 [Clostridia bacterium]|nr:hypothetical protein [Clostridia bacterium]
MKHIISLALCVILVATSTFSVFAAPSGKTVSTNDTEILRAISYGFVPGNLLGDWDKTINFSQYCTMLTNMITRYNSKLVPQWKKTASRALASNVAMHRDHGMLAAYYAACLMGIGQTTNGDWNYFNQVLGVDLAHGFDNNFEKWFPDCSKSSPFYDIDYKKHVSGWDYVTSSKFWCMGQFSPVSGNQVFETDFVHKSLRPMDNLSRKEAIKAVLRLYESSFRQTDNTAGSDMKSAKILALADERRDSIINSNTDITKSTAFVQGKTYTGTAYFVSSSGNDSNDGTSPEKPWATIKKVNSAELKYGDAVFFKRGDIWYDEEIWGQPGVTYSAYGTGAKPVFSGSVSENAASPDKWKLYYSDKSGKKIWVYYRELRECAGIFFNGGKSWANKVATCWDGRQYVFETGKRFDAVTGLTHNLDFFSCIDLSKIDPFDKVMETGVTGPLYLRCDAGNPGQLYGEIEFSLDGTGISPVGNNGRDMTVDNLKVVYFSMLGVSCGGDQGWTNTIVQNCEIGWCGGGTTKYTYGEGNSKIAYINNSGGAVHMSGPRNTVVNNYIHHCASKTLVMALHYADSASFIYSDVVIRGNLLEYNAAALHLVDYMEMENPGIPSGFKNVSFDDNYVMYTGYGWVETLTLRTIYLFQKVNLCSIEFGGRGYVNKNDGIFITNNIFYLSKYALIHCFMSKENQPVFSGNTYAQGQNGGLAMWRGRMLSITENGEKYVRNDLLDKTGTVLTVK